MSKWRALAGFVLGAASFGTGCSTNAVGVEQCQAIEQARCEAAEHCDVGLDTASARTECENFSRDNCLHGLPISETPTTGQINACVATIRAAGQCAAGGSTKTPAASCGLKGSALQPDPTACDVVENPEYWSECGFLVPTKQTTADAGG